MKPTDLWLCKPQHRCYRNPRHCGRCISVMLGAWTQVLGQRRPLTAESNQISILVLRAFSASLAKFQFFSISILHEV